MSVTQKRRLASGHQPASRSPGPQKTGYSPEELDAHSIRVPRGSSARARIEGRARPTMPRSPGGMTASASSS